MMKAAYFGNPWIGMFIRTNDSTTLVPIDSMDKFENAARESLKTETIRMAISDSNLLGIYVAMNSTGIILPSIVSEREVELVKKSGLNVHVSNERHNAHGNNIALNDKGGIINPHVEPSEARRMSDCLGVELVPMSVAGFTTVGSAVLATNEGFLAHFKASDDEIAALGEALKVQGKKGTVNMGTGFVAFGAAVNKNGYMVGEDTTPFEIGRLEEALGLIR